MYNGFMAYSDFDEALDFATEHAGRNRFCAKMVKQFDFLGYLTPAQVRAILKIKDERLASRW